MAVIQSSATARSIGIASNRRVGASGIMVVVVMVVMNAVSHHNEVAGDVGVGVEDECSCFVDANNSHREEKRRMMRRRIAHRVCAR